MKRSEIPVPSPCTADWASMSGDAVRRRCAQCAHDVHNLSEMTEPQARTMLSTLGRQGKLCVRYTSDRSGTVRFRRRAPRAAAAAVAVALMSTPAVAALELGDDTVAVEDDSGLLGRLRARVRDWLRPAPAEEAVVAEEEPEAETEEAEAEEEDLEYIISGFYVDPE